MSERGDRERDIASWQRKLAEGEQQLADAVTAGEERDHHQARAQRHQDSAWMHERLAAQYDREDSVET